MIKSKVFISYRRKDSDASSGRLYDALIQKPEYDTENLFKDIDSIPLGANFKKVIESKIAECDVVLAIIGNSFSSLTDDKGKPRILKEHDFVNMELSSAIKLNKIVIPVFVDNGSMPKVDELPETLKTLPFLNGLELRHNSWKRDIDKLREEINRANGNKTSLNISQIDDVSDQKNIEVLSGSDANKKEPVKQNTFSKKTSSKLVVFLGLFLLSIIAIVILKPWINKDNEVWEQALNENTLSSFENYEESYPEGRYAKIAIDSINSKLLFNSYKLAVSENSIVRFKAFLKDYPNSVYTKDVNQRLEALQKQVTTPIKKSSKREEIENKEVLYFNKGESILNNNSLALFIVNNKNFIDKTLIQKLSSELGRNNIDASISFFNNQSLKHYNAFYSANEKWINEIHLSNYLNTYLIGTITENVAPSTIDREITRVKLSFNGKLVNIKSLRSTTVTGESDESSYDAQEATKEAYKVIINEILASIKEEI